MADRILTRDEAMAAFRTLVSQYGLHWTAAVPAKAWAIIARINAVLDADDKREAIGFLQRTTPNLPRQELTQWRRR